MSIDLEWDKLDSSLASSLVDLLNRQIANTKRPSFIGPVEVTSLDFGSASPDVELVDLRDIHRDFLEDDEENPEAEHEPVKATEGADDEEGFEWVPRKATRAQSLAEDVPAYHMLPPHMRYGGGPTTDMFASTPSLRSPRDIWNPALANLADLRSSYHPSSGYASPMYRPFAPPAFGRPPLGSVFSGSRGDTDMSQSVDGDEGVPTPPSEPIEPQPAPPNHPNLQLHLHISWHSNLRLTFTTSLLINYPSPMFMSLPIKLSVTGLIFEGEVTVAYEGERRRIHLCIIDDLDPYGPLASDRPKRNTPSSEDDTPGMSSFSRMSKPLPVGQRLLPSIYIESEIGQADKHVYKNVAQLERFIRDMIRKTIEEELVFPNFHTIVLPDPQ